jgi:biofilm PGA synthesis N-glycosyltransferase PgaC
MAFEVPLFWSAFLLLIYTHVGYPLLAAACAWLRRRDARVAGASGEDALPTVSVVVVAHDEARWIDRRIRNLLALDYPAERISLLVASDGSTDGTAERARAYEDDAVRVFAFPVRRGKPAVLNEVVPQARGDIVVFADARQTFEAGAIRALVAPFADEAVGAVSGELVLRPEGETGLGRGMGFYWNHEKWIRRSESRVDSTVGATGAIYAIRSAAFTPIPPDTVLDDVLIPMQIVRRGYRTVFEPGARAWDSVPADPGHEFQRKVRTIAGTFQLFARERWLLSPLHNRLWIQTLSHKVLRLLTPFLLAAVLLSSLSLPGGWISGTALAGQAAFYAAAAAGHAFRRVRRPTPLFAVPYVNCLLAAATLVALVRLTAGGQAVTWKKLVQPT